MSCSRFLKFHASWLVLCFTYTTIAWSAPFVPSIIEVPISSLTQEIEIPSRLGTIQKRNSESPSSLVIHIQDAHGHFEGQKHTKEILKHLKDQYGIDLIFIEGATGELSADTLKFSQNSDNQKKIAEGLVREGLVGGAEWFLLEEGDNAYGVEDLGLYRENLAAYRALLIGRPAVQRTLDQLSQEISKQVSMTFNKKLKAFFEEWVIYQDRQSELMRHLDVLNQYAGEELQLHFSNSYEQIEWPQLTRFFKLKEFEKKLKPQKIEEEKQKILSWMKERGVETNLISSVIPASAKVRGGSVQRFAGGKAGISSQSPKQFVIPAKAGISSVRSKLERFYTIAAPKGFKFQDYPHFSDHVGSIILQSELDAILLFEESKKLSNQLLEHLSENQEEKKLIRHYKNYLLLHKLLNLKLISSEYAEVLQRKEQLLSLTKASDLFVSALDFYRGARAREDAMIQNMLTQMKATGKSKAVLVTGGFHADGLAQKFKEHNLSSLEIIPRLSKVDDGKAYEEVMSLKKNIPILNSTILNARLQAGWPGFSDTEADLYALTILFTFLNKGVRPRGSDPFADFNTSLGAKILGLEVRDKHFYREGGSVQYQEGHLGLKDGRFVTMALSESRTFKEKYPIISQFAKSLGHDVVLMPGVMISLIKPYTGRMVFSENVQISSEIFFQMLQQLKDPNVIKPQNQEAAAQIYSILKGDNDEQTINARKELESLLSRGKGNALVFLPEEPFLEGLGAAALFLFYAAWNRSFEAQEQTNVDRLNAAYAIFQLRLPQVVSSLKSITQVFETDLGARMFFLPIIFPHTKDLRNYLNKLFNFIATNKQGSKEETEILIQGLQTLFDLYGPPVYDVLRELQTSFLDQYADRLEGQDEKYREFFQTNREEMSEAIKTWSRSFQRSESRNSAPIGRTNPIDALHKEWNERRDDFQLAVLAYRMSRASKQKDPLLASGLLSFVIKHAKQHGELALELIATLAQIRISKRDSKKEEQIIRQLMESWEDTDPWLRSVIAFILLMETTSGDEDFRNQLVETLKKVGPDEAEIIPLLKSEIESGFISQKLFMGGKQELTPFDKSFLGLLESLGSHAWQLLPELMSLVKDESSDIAKERGRYVAIAVAKILNQVRPATPGAVDATQGVLSHANSLDRKSMVRKKFYAEIDQVLPKDKQKRILAQVRKQDPKPYVQILGSAQEPLKNRQDLIRAFEENDLITEDGDLSVFLEKYPESFADNYPTLAQTRLVAYLENSEKAIIYTMGRLVELFMALSESRNEEFGTPARTEARMAQSVDILIANLEKKDVKRMAKTITDIGRWKRDAARAIPILIGIFRNRTHYDANIRSRAILALSRIQKDIGHPTIGIYREAFEDSEVGVQSAAASAVGHLGKLGKRLKVYLEQALESSHESVKIEAALAVHAVSKPTEQELLDYPEVLKSQTPEKSTERLKAIAYLARATQALETPNIIESIQGFLSSRNAAKRYLALRVLRKHHLSDLSEQYISTLKNDPSEKVREEAMLALADLGEDAKSSFDEIVDRLQKDPSVRVRVAIANNLNSIATTDQSVPVLASLLQVPEKKVRLSAISALERIGSAAEGAKEALASLAQDASVETAVQQAAAAATTSDPALVALQPVYDEIFAFARDYKDEIVGNFRKYRHSGSGLFKHGLVEAMFHSNSFQTPAFYNQVRERLAHYFNKEHLGRFLAQSKDYKFFEQSIPVTGGKRSKATLFKILLGAIAEKKGREHAHNILKQLMLYVIDAAKTPRRNGRPLEDQAQGILKERLVLQDTLHALEEQRPHVQRAIRYSFPEGAKRSFYQIAFTETHKPEFGQGETQLNHMLSFLGDALLEGWIAKHSAIEGGEKEGTSYLYDELTFLKRDSLLFAIAKVTQLDQFFLTNNVDGTLRNSKNIDRVSNSVEAVIASVYLSGGIDALDQFLQHLYAEAFGLAEFDFVKILEHIHQNSPIPVMLIAQDPKSWEAPKPDEPTTSVIEKAVGFVVLDPSQPEALDQRFTVFYQLFRGKHFLRFPETETFVFEKFIDGKKAREQNFLMRKGFVEIPLEVNEQVSVRFKEGSNQELFRITLRTGSGKGGANFEIESLEEEEHQYDAFRLEDQIRNDLARLESKAPEIEGKPKKGNKDLKKELGEIRGKIDKGSSDDGISPEAIKGSLRSLRALSKHFKSNRYSRDEVESYKETFEPAIQEVIGILDVLKSQAKSESRGETEVVSQVKKRIQKHLERLDDTLIEKARNYFAEGSSREALREEIEKAFRWMVDYVRDYYQHRDLETEDELEKVEKAFKDLQAVLESAGGYWEHRSYYRSPWREAKKAGQGFHWLNGKHDPDRLNLHFSYDFNKRIDVSKVSGSHRFDNADVDAIRQKSIANLRLERIFGVSSITVFRPPLSVVELMRETGEEKPYFEIQTLESRIDFDRYFEAWKEAYDLKEGEPLEALDRQALEALLETVPEALRESLRNFLVLGYSFKESAYRSKPLELVSTDGNDRFRFHLSLDEKPAGKLMSIHVSHNEESVGWSDFTLHADYAEASIQHGYDVYDYGMEQQPALFVEDDYKRRGIGAVLLTLNLYFSAIHGAKRFDLKDIVGPLEFFRSIGFRSSEHERNGKKIRDLNEGGESDTEIKQRAKDHIKVNGTLELELTSLPGLPEIKPKKALSETRAVTAVAKVAGGFIAVSYYENRNQAIIIIQKLNPNREPLFASDLRKLKSATDIPMQIYLIFQKVNLKKGPYALLTQLSEATPKLVKALGGSTSQAHFVFPPKAQLNRKEQRHWNYLRKNYLQSRLHRAKTSTAEVLATLAQTQPGLGRIAASQNLTVLTQAEGEVAVELFFDQEEIDRHQLKVNLMVETAPLIEELAAAKTRKQIDDILAKAGAKRDSQGRARIGLNVLKYLSSLRTTHEAELLALAAA